MNELKGYYICSCGEEYISDFLFEECTCLSCNKQIKITKKITVEEEIEIKKSWKAK